MPLTLTSPAFGPKAEIPAVHTCEGADTSPPLEWSGVPGRAKSLALIVDDPDAPDPKAPRMTYVHWVLYNIAPVTTRLPEGAARGGLPPVRFQSFLPSRVPGGSPPRAAPSGRR